MSAIELYKKQDEFYVSCGIFYCSVCRVVHRSKEEAEWCHGERLCACGNKVMQGYYQSLCSECQSKEWREKEAKREFERYEAAKKVAYAEYEGGMLYDGDRYFTDMEEVEDHYFDSPLPEYVWACKDIGVQKLDAEDVVQNIVENMWENADCGDLNGMVELDTACREFNAANESISVWEPDYKIAILIKTNTGVRDS